MNWCPQTDWTILFILSMLATNLVDRTKASVAKLVQVWEEIGCNLEGPELEKQVPRLTFVASLISAAAGAGSAESQSFLPATAEIGKEAHGGIKRWKFQMLTGYRK